MNSRKPIAFLESIQQYALIHMMFVTFNKLINYRQVFLGEEISKQNQIQKQQRQQQQKLITWMNFIAGKSFR